MSFAGSSLSEREVKDWIAQSVEHLFREKLDELLSERLTAFVKENEQRARELSLMERVVRVEEELRALKEIQIVHFKASEKRFEAIEKRFEAMDKRFESLQREMIVRFEAVDKRFEAMEKRFEAMQRETNARFEAMQRETNARFEAMDKRFTQLQWTIGLGFGLMAAIMGTLRFLG
ncbi:MAG: hypothetical protein WHS46_01540 [Desulfosoma sp.]